MRSRSTLLAHIALVSTFVGALHAVALANTAVPLSLADAVRTALQQNAAYREALTHTLGAQAALAQAQSTRGFALTLSDGELYTSPVAQLATPFGTLPFSPSDFASTPLLAARYVAYDGGARAARIAASQAALAQTFASANAARQQTISAVTKLYYGLSATLALQRVARDAVTVASRHVSQTEQRLHAGTVARAALLRTQTELADVRVAEIRADNAVAVAQASLDQAMAVPQDVVHQPTSPLTASVPDYRLSALITSSQTRRPELAAATSAVDIAKAAVAAARAEHRPTIALTASDGNVQPPIERGFHNQVSLGLQAVWKLFDNGYSADAVRKARAETAGATLAVANLRSKIELQVRKAYLAVQAGKANVQASRTLVRFADENLRLALIRSQAGVGTPLEVADAARRDRAAQRTLVQSEADLQSASIDLQLASGQL